MITDVHSHCIPDPFRRWLTEHGPRVGAEVIDLPEGQCVRFPDETQTGPQFSWRSLSDIDARLSDMDRMGIDRQLLSGWIDLAGYELAPEMAEEYCRAHNQALAEIVSAHPDRFVALGTTPLQDPPAAARVLRHGVEELGMAGAQLATRIGDQYIDRHLDLDEFWSAAEELGAFLLLHPVRPLPSVDLDRYLLENSVGRPAETSIALAGLIMSGVFEQHPSLRVCAVHGGGFTPFQIGRLDQSFRQLPQVAGKQISRPPSTYLESIYVDSIVHDSSALRFLIDRLGADHILLGTDYPFPMGDPDPIASIDATPGLTSTERASILGETANELIR